jgi:hypothetical protein
MFSETRFITKVSIDQFHHDLRLLPGQKLIASYWVYGSIIQLHITGGFTLSSDAPWRFYIDDQMETAFADARQDAMPQMHTAMQLLNQAHPNITAYQLIEDRFILEFENGYRLECKTGWNAPAIDISWLGLGKNGQFFSTDDIRYTS